MKGASASLRASDWLSLAAAPTFALMALLTAVGGDSDTALLCAEGARSSPLAGMAPMYLLMAGFHLVPWLRLIDRGRA